MVYLMLIQLLHINVYGLVEYFAIGPCTCFLDVYVWTALVYPFDPQIFAFSLSFRNFLGTFPDKNHWTN